MSPLSPAPSSSASPPTPPPKTPSPLLPSGSLLLPAAGPCLAPTLHSLPSVVPSSTPSVSPTPHLPATAAATRYSPHTGSSTPANILPSFSLPLSSLLLLPPFPPPSSSSSPLSTPGNALPSPPSSLPATIHRK